MDAMQSAGIQNTIWNIIRREGALYQTVVDCRNSNLNVRDSSTQVERKLSSIPAGVTLLHCKRKVHRRLPNCDVSETSIRLSVSV